ncbi:hypothetical protein BDN72DRAFT_643440 [Pluteus cervinus]|uniref:Uncharacterized protein n=1 Tax=Pluteus cervinus TaxID=181527 RepID=A0ACD3AUN4_9AGAR|nr:hypothetical protein BDN72DRAFT_643440 [Pluteus cervinus]
MEALAWCRFFWVMNDRFFFWMCFGSIYSPLNKRPFIAFGVCPRVAAPLHPLPNHCPDLDTRFVNDEWNEVGSAFVTQWRPDHEGILYSSSPALSGRNERGNLSDYAEVDVDEGTTCRAPHVLSFGMAPGSLRPEPPSNHAYILKSSFHPVDSHSTMEYLPDESFVVSSGQLPEIIHDARQGSLVDLVSLARVWASLPNALGGIHTVFLHHLNSLEVPTEPKPDITLEEARAFWSLWALTKLGWLLVQSGSDTDPCGRDIIQAWPGIFKWSAYLFTYRVQVSSTDKSTNTAPPWSVTRWNSFLRSL